MLKKVLGKEGAGNAFFFIYMNDPLIIHTLDSKFCPNVNSLRTRTYTSSLYSPQGLNLEQYFGNTEHFVGKQSLADLMCSNTQSL